MTGVIEAEKELLEDHQHTMTFFDVGGLRAAPEDCAYDEFGMKKRFVYLFRDNLRFVPAWGWLVWDKRRWTRDAMLHVQRFAEQVAMQLISEAGLAKNEHDRSMILDLARKYQSLKRRELLIEDAKSHQLLIARAEMFDTNPWEINCLNGLLNLQTGVLSPHEPRKCITKLAPVKYDPEAQCPLFHEFLTRIFNENEDTIAFVQKALGYSLTGSQREQVFFILYGTGANGKSTFLNVVRSILGPDYALQADTSMFMERQAGGIPNDIARLQGIRLVSAVETSEGRRLNEAFVKSATGGEPITARFLHKEFFEFTPQFKIFLATNHKPTIRGTDYAIWRRIRMIPFVVTIPEVERDKNLEAKLLKEKEGILAWMVQGCQKYLAEGLPATGDISTATAAYREEMDVLGNFLDERCIISPSLSASVRDLYRAYVSWAEQAGEYPIQQRKLGTRLAERGFRQEHSRRGWFWVGIGIRNDIPDIEDN